MYILSFANGQSIEAVDGVISAYDNSMAEQRDAFSFEVKASDITFPELKSLVENPKNTQEIILTNDSVNIGEIEPISISEAYYGYVDLVSIFYKRRTMVAGLLNVPQVYEWVYEVYLAERTNSQKQLEHINSLLTNVDDENAEKYIDAFPMWSTMGMFDGFKHLGSYAKGDRVRYSELLYKCVQSHNIDVRQLDWNPADANNLWTRISNPTDEWPNWIAPTGAHNSYVLGSKATHSNRRWIAIVDNNVWEPGIYGWEEVV